MRIPAGCIASRRSNGALAVLASAAISACGGSHTPASPSSTSNGSGVNVPAGTLTLRVSPIDQSAIRWITPLGNLNPPAHPIPTDHIYFYFADPDARETAEARRTDFFAPGDGTVTTVLGSVGTESKVFIQQTSTFSYYLDHLILSVPLQRGSAVTAGQRLGTTGSAYGIDLGVINQSLNLNFLIPSHYIGDTIHADAPLKYFAEPIRSQLYARVQRVGSDLDGKIDFDVAGRLAGNWFLGSNALLAFVYDTYDPSSVRISTGAGALQGVFSIAAGEPAPSDVSPASGKVTYTLTRAITGPPRTGINGVAGYMLVEMTDATHLRMETFIDRPTDFTAAAGTYAR
jgi:hypothetical protein